MTPGENRRPPGLLHKVLLFAYVLLLCLVAAEYAVRQFGFEPGFVPRYRYGVLPVDSLRIVQLFAADDEGVFKFNLRDLRPHGYAVNPQGFRGPDLDFTESDKPKILMLGDSFVWGDSANPITNCFADLVAHAGFLVYNTGIPGTGPQQYAVLAEKYVPVLRPEIVAVVLFMGNDLLDADQLPVEPNRHPFHITNAGWIKAYDDQGRYMTPQEAYAYYLASNNLVRTYLGSDSPNALCRLLRESVLGSHAGVRVSQAWQAFCGGHGPRPPEPAHDIVVHALKRIRQVCCAHDARFLVFVIPDHPRKRASSGDDAQVPPFLATFSPMIPDTLTEDDYMPLPDDHLNNGGHRKYATFILDQIESFNSGKTGAADL